jgi:hypothetical protein
MADNLPPSSADVMESESLNLPEIPGPHRPVMGLLNIPFTFMPSQDHPFAILILTIPTWMQKF